MKRYLLPALFSMFMAQGAFADAFQISDIRVNGLQRVSAGSVFTSLPLNIGDPVQSIGFVILLNAKLNFIDNKLMQKIGTGQYRDLTREWYFEIGSIFVLREILFCIFSLFSFTFS